MTSEPMTVVRLKKRRGYYTTYRWKAMGFSSSRKCQEYLRLFKQDECHICHNDRFLHSIVFGYDITIHHLDGNKKNNHPFNLQTLCATCHARIDPSFHLHYSRMLKRKWRVKK